MGEQALLEILADGKFHSGQELGELLGVSRSAIWKQIRKLEALGLEIYSVKGRGYRLPGGIELLDSERIGQALDAAVAARLQRIELEMTLASTNQAALQASQQGDSHGVLFLAERQTAGRGRRGRQWASPFGANLYFSLVWRFQTGAQALEGLSLLVGLALVESLQPQLPEPLLLKWPNDLLCRQRKLAGILLEMSGDPQGDCQVVIGVGINVQMPLAAAEAIDQPWIDLAGLNGGPVSRNQLLAAVLNSLVPKLERFAVEGFAPFRDAWQAVNAYQDAPVKLLLGPREVEGVCLGVDESGALRLRMADGEQLFHGGEISLRQA
ncbi:bifunctional biotin--[acetyl-CoA-carboxylase] ligase/biotin operon repressor BirA [Marinobacterium arenosum]|uniref:bifunctional biotin--[acetyl-CoA-carboxylase] ligase/biotin operon repressor BirA n=1 Tax=Marinobacterium arenosum TaxID=2862496 RepID=UPI001C987D87|nr:bifunctional biotin--[acetyl-CoA-carboxylase] ligase/biotin operon repressor BirA [Marinobacterium arenosum]MBY4676885.1 bifunctional biotin--[acetyl-CoA-carboxylase] ligase/biotin operon repressor BirA [Marinobacterium arenosum]